MDIAIEEVLLFATVIIFGFWCYYWYQRTHKNDIGIKERD
jgi:hypothetical protein